MATTAVATLQTPWDCRWSRPGHQLTGIHAYDQPESLWVCVRMGRRELLEKEDCESCPFWEAEEEYRG